MQPRCSHNGCCAKLDLISQSLICKCEKTFCVRHRAAELHECAYDYQKAGRVQNMKYLSTPIVAKKVDVI